jgi:hypothetical protein
MRLVFLKLLAFFLLFAGCAVGGVSEMPPSEPMLPDARDEDPVAEEGPADFTAASFGMSTLSDPNGWAALIAAVSEPGIVGCALVQDGADPTADPAERVRVKLDVGFEGANTLCAEGTYPLRNDASCRADALQTGCAVYERWDDEGSPVVQRAAAGGAVGISAQRGEDGFVTGCVVELDLRFAGGTRFAHTFRFVVDPFNPESRTCVHDGGSESF